jgi:hypothetical protein
MFVNSSYFARDPGARNSRYFGGSDHWAGPEPTWKWEVDGRSRNWPVVHQKFALANLLSRYTVEPEVWADQIEDGFRLERMALTLKYHTLVEPPRFQLRFVDERGNGLGSLEYDLRIRKITESLPRSWKVSEPKPSLDPKTHQEVVTLTWENLHLELRRQLKVEVTRVQSGMALKLSSRPVVLAEWQWDIQPDAMPWDMVRPDVVAAGEVGPANTYEIKDLPALP